MATNNYRHTAKIRVPVIEEDEMSLDNQITVYDMRIRALTERRNALAAIRYTRAVQSRPTVVYQAGVRLLSHANVG